jgi:O-glycosyl hydrolase
MKILQYALVITVMFLFSACGTSIDSGNSASLKINYNEYRQEIDGFGGSNAWTRPPRDYETAQELVKLLYSKTGGVGFTILRNRIPFRERLSGDDNPGYNDGFVVRKSDDSYDYAVNNDGTKTFNLNWNSWDLSGTRNLIEYILALGADGPEKLVVMSTPWTPPNNRVTRWKEDVTGINANFNYTMDWTKPDIWGRLRRDVYSDYADLLADYVKNFESRMGWPLAILSVQNEPNYKVQYESAYWNGNDIRDFLKVIGQRFPMKGITLGEGGLGVMAPEFENFNVNFNNLIKPSLDDPESEKVLTHIALHQYNGASDTSSRAGSKAFPEINASGKRFWQTEVSGSGSQIPAGTGIDNALYYARMIHFDMTLAQTNAFLYWWLWTGSSNSFPGSLIYVEEEEIKAALRLYAMGQYSRFIRPGWIRIDCDAAPSTGVYSSAYRNPGTNEIAVVVINERITPSPVSLYLDGAEFDRLEIWRTSADEKLKLIGRQRTSRGNANVNLQPRSITTFYGTVKN